MKKFFKGFAVTLLASMMFTSVACGQSSDEECDTYTITFTQDGFSDITYKVEAGASLTELPQPNSVTGYTVVWEEKDLTNIQSNITISAIATPNQYQITYVLSTENGETLEGETVQTVEYDSQYTLKTPERYAYSFVGWKSKGVLIPQSGVWKYVEDLTLTASWVDNFYKITFVQNGTAVEKILEYGEVLSADEIPELITEPGYDISWSITDFSEINKNTVVTTNKVPKSYKVEYLLEADEQLEGDLEQSVTYSKPYQLKQPTKEGYTFVGWEWYSDDGVKTFSADPQAEWKITSDVSLKALWTANRNLITFIHADNTREEITIVTGEIPTNIPAPKQIDGYDVEWSVKDFSSITESMTVTAIPVPKKYNVTYCVEGDSSINGIQKQVTYAAEYELAQPAPKYGYTFDYWLTEDGKAVPVKGTWNLIGDQKLTPVWANNYFTITFVHVDGTEESRIIEKGDSLAEAPACQTVTGHTVKWDIANVSEITQDQTVYAVAIPNKYRITFELAANESLPAGASTYLEVEYGQSYTLITPTNLNDDKVFTGWVNTKTGKALPFTGVWKYEQNITLKATWAREWTDNY